MQKSNFIEIDDEDENDIFYEREGKSSGWEDNYGECSSQLQNQCVKLDNMTEEPRHRVYGQMFKNQRGMNIIGQLVIQVKNGGGKKQLRFGTASIYKKLDETTFVIISAGHNFTFNDAQYLQGNFLLMREGQRTFHSRFKVLEFGVHQDYKENEEGNIEFGTDVSLAVVQIEFTKKDAQQKREFILNSLPVEDDIPAVKGVTEAEFSKLLGTKMVVSGYPQKILSGEGEGDMISGENYLFTEGQEEVVKEDEFDEENEPNYNNIAYVSQDYEKEATIAYHLTTNEGYSGGPIFQRDGDGQPVLLGIHNGISSFEVKVEGEEEEEEEEMNCGMVITQNVIDTFIQPELDKYEQKYVLQNVSE